MQQTVEIFECDERQLANLISELLRALDFDQAERILANALSRTPSKLTDACLQLRLDTIAFSGWDRIFAEFVKLQRKGKNITAIGVDISGHDGDGDDPALELSFYDDSEFPFSVSTREEILAACPAYSPPWTGCFIDLTGDLQIAGLSKLHLLLRGYPNRYQIPSGPVAKLSNDDRAFKLAEWWMYLRFHQALYRDINDAGLPKGMPVVLCEHDYGPWFGNVLIIQKMGKDSSLANEIINADTARYKAEYAKITSEAVHDFREHRSFALSMRAANSIGKMGPLLELNEARDALRFSISDINIEIPTWQLNDAEFEDLLDRYQLARDPEYRRSQNESWAYPVAGSKSIAQNGFGRKGLSDTTHISSLAQGQVRQFEESEPQTRRFGSWQGIKLYLLLIIGLPVLFGLKDCAAGALGL